MDVLLYTHAISSSILVIIGCIMLEVLYLTHHIPEGSWSPIMFSIKGIQIFVCFFILVVVYNYERLFITTQNTTATNYPGSPSMDPPLEDCPPSYAVACLTHPSPAPNALGIGSSIFA